MQLVARRVCLPGDDVAIDCATLFVASLLVVDSPWVAEQKELHHFARLRWEQ